MTRALTTRRNGRERERKKKQKRNKEVTLVTDYGVSARVRMLSIKTPISLYAQYTSYIPAESVYRRHVLAYTRQHVENTIRAARTRVLFERQPSILRSIILPTLLNNTIKTLCRYGADRRPYILNTRCHHPKKNPPALDRSVVLLLTRRCFLFFFSFFFCSKTSVLFSEKITV